MNDTNDYRQDASGGFLTEAATDVLAERRAQVMREGYTADHDDQHVDRELAAAAACYALSGANLVALENYWPWTPSSFKPKSPRRDLVRAVALLLAEIERLDRVQRRRDWKHEVMAECNGPASDANRSD